MVGYNAYKSVKTQCCCTGYQHGYALNIITTHYCRLVFIYCATKSTESFVEISAFVSIYCFDKMKHVQYYCKVGVLQTGNRKLGS